MKLRHDFLAVLFAAIATFLVTFSTNAKAADGPDPAQSREIISNAISKFVQPRYAEFEEAAKLHLNAARQLCEAPGEENLEKVRDAYKGLVMAWSKIEIVRFGPVASDNRYERVIFYPDRKSTGLRQVQRILARDVVLEWDLPKLQENSVAVQGLGGLEFALFGSGANKLAGDEGKGRCHYVMLAGENVLKIAGELNSAWQQEDGISHVWLNPGSENPAFRDEREALSELIATLIHGLGTIRDIRIGSFAGTARKAGIPATAIYRRSGLTMQSVTAGLESVRDLFNVSGIEGLLPEDNAGLADDFRQEMALILKAANDFSADQAEEDIVTILASQENRDNMEYLRQDIRFVMNLLDGGFSAAAGLAAGFSFGDGD